MTGTSSTITLKNIAYARSGDKGSGANIGVIAYSETGYQFLQHYLTEERVFQFFQSLPVTNVVRYELPNLQALNFVLHGILGKGGSRSLAIDAQGKALGQALLTMPIDVELPQDVPLQNTATVLNEAAVPCEVNVRREA